MGIRKETRPIRIEGDIAFIPLTKGYEAIIDTADVGLVSGIHWYANASTHTVYAQCCCYRGGKRAADSLHRKLLGAPAGLKVDHVDGNGLNNRRSNIRLATHAQNITNQRRRSDNKSGFKGVSRYKKTRKWIARITISGCRKRLGYFETPEAAHAAYVRASQQLFGEFARAS